MQRLTLNGPWHYQRHHGEESGTAHVPGDIYRDLLENGQIADPFWRDNEEHLQWIGESDWTFHRTFDVSPALLDHARVKLCCDGLDTIATVRINDKVIAQTHNMFRRWQWDIPDMLHLGENTIAVTFASAVKFCEAVADRRGLGDKLYPNKIYAAIPGMIRKQQCNFGWDWGIKAVTCGIWRDIEIIAYDTARLSALKITQDHDTPGQVGLRVEADIDALGPAELTLRASVQFDGRLIATAEQAVGDTRGSISMVIGDPQLWWPNQLGRQPLYDVKIELLDCGGQTLDARGKRIGLRTLRLDRHDDPWGESFQFVINGLPFFAKGANWIPADAIQARMTSARYRRLVEDAAAANMNMLRVWGGGIYEDDGFYDACDELGICVWQEFMFGGGTSPLEEADFRDDVLAEARDQIRRLRHHPCVALWCGNNEMEMDKQLHDQQPEAGKMSWQAYSDLFDVRLAEVVAELAPGCDYWPSSPHTPRGDRSHFNNPTCGDAHLWDVWHEGRPFEWYRTCHHRFNSEFGFQSLPEPKTVYAFTHEDDRNITSYVMEQHQRSHGNPRIIQYMLSWFRAPDSFESTLWLSQILQGMSIKYACEHWRRNMPRGMGTLYWQLNDCWPVASWSSIDYFGRCKALHYMARHFFAPLMISGVEDVTNETVEIHLTSDLLKSTSATMRWIVTDIDGQVLLETDQPVTAAAQSTQCVHTLDLGQWVAAHEKRGLLVWLELESSGHPISRNLVFFARPIRRPRVFSPRPKHLDLSRDPGIESSITPRDDGTFDVTLTSRKPALWTWLELDGINARFSDNFFHMRAAAPMTVHVVPPECLSLDAISKQLTVRSLVDTYK